jgi:hypothetical protein
MVFSVHISIKTPVFIKSGVFFPTIFYQNFNFCARLAQNSGLFYPQIYIPAFAVQQTTPWWRDSSAFNCWLFSQ